MLLIAKNLLFRNKRYWFYLAKKKLTGTLVLVGFFNCLSIAQNNLVPNGSFETYSTCPIGTLGEINKAIPWFQPNYPYAGAGGSSDYYNFCAGYDCSSFKQCPRTGTGMAGIALFTYPTLYNTDYWREYIEVGLTDTLKAGRNYCIKYHVNMLDNSCYPIKQIQAVLTNDSLLYNDSNYGYIQGVIPISEPDSIIKDSIGWTEIKETFFASGGERFITLGNFANGSSVSYESICGSISGTSYPGYYYFDDISIYEQPQVFAGNDTLIPPGDSVQLGITGRPDIIYSWSPTTGLNNPNVPNPLAAPSTSITYVLTVTDTNQLACNSVLYDTVSVEVGYVGINENMNIFQTGKLYPNPASTSCLYEINLPSLQGGRAVLCDLIGRQLQTEPLKVGENRIIMNLSDYTNGIYLYKIIINGNTVDYKKLIIQR